MDLPAVAVVIVGLLLIFVAIKALPVFMRAWGFWGFCFWVICLPIPFAWIFLIYAAFFV
ncbi:hypothetical protein KBA63_05200 [Candidatus Woesebacteria bacterium]|nr:hypothetical protein [Candidatus Woesebacteria bacterium]MBP9687599.1 hypothetical protein [Candidatus Woesebacteria bacterium]